MKSISEHIRQLLFQHDCVIIPEFGAFIVNTEEGSYQAEQHLFSPDWKRPFFNRQMKNNDGMLAAALVERENLPYHEALNEIRRFRDSLNEQLENHQQARMQGLGNLELNHEGQITFTPDQSANLNAATFGLPALNLNPVEQPQAMKVGRSGGKRWAWIAAASVILALGAFGFFFNQQVLDHPFMSNLDPFSLDSSVNDSTEPQGETGNKEQNQGKETGTETVTHTTENKDSEQKDIVTIDPADQDKQEDADGYEETKSGMDSVYYIVVGSFKHPNLAGRYERKLKMEGYSACTFSNESSPYVRICAEQHQQRFEAEERLGFIRSSANQAAWILAVGKE